MIDRSPPPSHQIVYATRHREAATVLAAGCVNEALSLALKKALRQPRPAARCALLDTCGRAGMPSSHAQVCEEGGGWEGVGGGREKEREAGKISCGSTPPPLLPSQSVVFAVAVHAVLAFGVRPAAALESGVLTVAAAVICGSRIYLGYHTPAQVAVGAALGAALGVGVGRAVKAGRKGGKRRAKRG